MVEFIPPPDPYSLLPPFLACLPTSFASHRPPPSLVALLSPILRQRIQLLTSTSETTSWLKLLCWDKDKAEELQRIVEQGTWEPHPVSGEIEVSGVDNIVYKRFDEETLRARISLSDQGLTILYLWCAGDQGETGWRVAELIPYSVEEERDPTWASSISDANSSFSDRTLSEALSDAEKNEKKGDTEGVENGASDVDEDDYWAQYDRTPGGRTPAMKRSPHPQSQGPQSNTADDEYYARYSSVQPAMDSTDPSEEPSSHEQDNGQSTLNGNTFSHLLRRQSNSHSPSPHINDNDMSQPQPSRPSSSASGSDTVAKLEQTAELQSNSEVSVRQHISTSMKSMYRLATSMGMDREEFARIVRRELDVLELLE